MMISKLFHRCNQHKAGIVKLKWLWEYSGSYCGSVSDQIRRPIMTFKAICLKKFGGPEVLMYEDFPILSPAKNQLLVSIYWAGVTPYDTYLRSGDQHYKKIKFPFIPGCDGAGIVEQIGEGVTKFKKGDRVYFARTITGSYAEFTLTDEARTFKLHPKFSFAQGAAIGVPFFTAYRAVVTKAGLKPGQTVLVHGASGSVGLACCQIAKCIGAKVYGTAGTEEGIKLVSKNGAYQVFNHKQDGYISKIKDATGGGLDVIIEMHGDVNLEKDMEMANSNAQIIIVGSRGKIEISPRLMMMKELFIQGLALYSPTVTESEWAEMGAFVDAGQEQGWLQPVIDREYPLTEAQEAQKEMIARVTGAKGKIILKVREAHE